MYLLHTEERYVSQCCEHKPLLLNSVQIVLILKATDSKLTALLLEGNIGQFPRLVKYSHKTEPFSLLQSQD